MRIDQGKRRSMCDKFYSNIVKTFNMIQRALFISGKPTDAAPDKPVAEIDAPKTEQNQKIKVLTTPAVRRIAAQFKVCN